MTDDRGQTTDDSIKSQEQGAWGTEQGKKQGAWGMEHGAKDRGQKTEDGSQRTEVGGQRSEGRGKRKKLGALDSKEYAVGSKQHKGNPEVKLREDRGQTTDDSKNRSQRSEVRGQQKHR